MKSAALGIVQVLGLLESNKKCWWVALCDAQSSKSAYDQIQIPNYEIIRINQACTASPYAKFADRSSSSWILYVIHDNGTEFVGQDSKRYWQVMG